MHGQKGEHANSFFYHMTSPKVIKVTHKVLELLQTPRKPRKVPKYTKKSHKYKSKR